MTAQDRIGRLRSLFPYPLPEVTPSWRTSAVVAMASGIREEGAWGRLEVLADALEDADCADGDILAHLRHDQLVRQETIEGDYLHTDGKFPNRNGGCWEGTCWVVQALLHDYQRVLARYRHRGTMWGDWQFAPVVNPGDGFGRVWIVVPETYAGGPEFAVEASNPSDAEDDFIDSEFGKNHRLDETELPDYMTDPGVWGDNPRPPEYSCRFTDDGHAFDSEGIYVYGREREGHRGVRYFGPGVPHRGVRALAYSYRGPCDECGHERFPMVHTLPHRICSPRCLRKIQEDREIELHPEGGPP